MSSLKTSTIWNSCDAKDNLEILVVLKEVHTYMITSTTEFMLLILEGCMCLGPLQTTADAQKCFNVFSPVALATSWKHFVHLANHRCQNMNF